MRRKIIMIAVLGWLVFYPGAVLAVDASSEIPELNPLCWTEEDCKDIRSKNFGVDSEGGWLKGEKPCNKAGWGKCLPAGKTKTEISFGGRTEFANVGEFILVMYKYLVAIASILAVIVIIVSGVQWTASGGNSEIISSSKKRIGGAIIGLFIAYTSFFVLNTINPALVNLRLPQVFLIKPQALMPEFCSEVEGAKDGKTNFMLAADTDKKNQKANIDINNAVGKDEGYKWSLKESPGMFWCGKRFFAENGGAANCWGDYCDKSAAGTSKMCIDWTDGYSCEEGNIGGVIRNSALLKGGLGTVITENWEDPPVNGVEVIAYCNKKFTALSAEWDNVFYRGFEAVANYFESEDSDEKILMADGGMLMGRLKLQNLSDKQAYIGRVREARLARILPFCEDWEGLKGFVLRLWMDEDGDKFDEIHYVGRGGVDLGDKARGGDVGFFDAHAYDINSQYFFTLDEVVGKRQKRVNENKAEFEILDALRVNIDAADITDIDTINVFSGAAGDELRKEKYGYLLQ